MTEIKKLVIRASTTSHKEYRAEFEGEYTPADARDLINAFLDVLYLSETKEIHIYIKAEENEQDKKIR